MKKLLIVPALVFVAHQSMASNDLNLSENVQFLTWTDVTTAVDSGVKVLSQWGSDAFNKTKALAKKYGPEMWTAAVQYGPAFVNWVLANQDTIFKFADAVQKYNQSAPAAVPALPAPKEE